MKSLGDYLDMVIDKFRNTKTADIFMYIGSVITSFFHR